MAARAASWLSRGDNSFHLMLFLTLPALLAILAIGFF